MNRFGSSRHSTTHETFTSRLSSSPLGGYRYQTSVMAKDKKSKALSKANVPTTETVKPPAWPVFKPPLPVMDLQPESMLDSRVVLIRNFWPKSLCRDYVSFLRTLTLTTTPGKPKRGDAVRVNDRFQVQDQAFANRLWLQTGLQDVLMGEDWKGLW